MKKICEECFKPMIAGMTDESGRFYCCEDCFPKYMDKTHGEGNWKAVDDDGCGGYYIVRGDDGEWYGTGIFYTEWEEE